MRNITQKNCFGEILAQPLFIPLLTYWRRDCKFYGSELFERTFTFRNTKECLLNVDDEEKYLLTNALSHPIHIVIL